MLFHSITAMLILEVVAFCKNSTIKPQQTHKDKTSVIAKGFRTFYKLGKKISKINPWPGTLDTDRLPAKDRVTKL